MEGIVIYSVPYRDWDQILSLFTSEMGLIKLFYKGKKGKGQNQCALMNRVEVTFQRRHSNLFCCEEMILLDTFAPLRENYKTLVAGCELIDLVKNSQWEEKPAPALYQLLKVYLSRLPTALDPATIVASFRLKILRHEGLLGFPIETPLKGLHFTQDEMPFLELMAFGQSFKEIALQSTCQELQNKIEQVFIRYFE